MDFEKNEKQIAVASTGLALPITDEWALPVITSLVNEIKDEIKEPGIYFARLIISQPLNDNDLEPTPTPKLETETSCIEGVLHCAIRNLATQVAEARNLYVKEIESAIEWARSEKESYSMQLVELLEESSQFRLGVSQGKIHALDDMIDYLKDVLRNGN